MGFTFNLISQLAELMLKTNMNHGKNICRQLKQLRRDIADANGIELHQKECTYQGECEGTCPYCDAELQYIERELARRQGLGKVVAVAGAMLTVASLQSVQAQEPVIMGKPAVIQQTDGNGALKGTVMDQNRKDPIIGCHIILRREGVVVSNGTTDIDGIYTVKHLQKGSYTLEFTQPGYKKVTYNNVTVKNDGFTVFNVLMEPVNNQGTELPEPQIVGIAPIQIADSAEANITPTVIIDVDEDGEASPKYAIGGVEVQLNGTPASVPAEPSPVGRKVDDDNTNPLDNCVR